jgi:hypothetical protein
MGNDSSKIIARHFDHLFRVISGERFLSRQGLGNEVPFFIYPFDPAWQNEIDKHQAKLRSKLDKNGVAVLEINLFDLSVELLQARGLWDRLLNKEPTMSRPRLKEQMQAVLDPEAKLVPAIAQKMKDTEFKVLFITGVGLVYPFVRTHNILNNLQKVAKDQPLVMFFPGNYTYVEGSGSSLDLFGALNEDKYYRAFNIIEFQL